MPEQREHLVIGCGHGFMSCKLSHPASQFETVNIDPAFKPDVVLDVTEREQFAQQYQGKTFSSITMEGVLLEDEISYLQKYLKDNGNIVLVGNFLFETIAALNVGARFYSINSDNWNFRGAIIIPNSDHFSIDPILQSYINSITKNKKFQMHEVRITNELKMHAELLNEILKVTGEQGPHLPSGYVVAALLSPPNKESIKAGHIRKMAESYTPGWWRRHIGKTKGMKELYDYLNNYADNDVLGEQDLNQLLKLIQNRLIRLGNNYNPARNATGSTTQVFKQIAVAILNYRLSHGMDLLALYEEKGHDKKRFLNSP